MAAYNGVSERKALRGALERIISGQDDNGSLKVLIAGLGIGYSLDEALLFQEVSKTTVVEIELAVIRWNRTVFRREPVRKTAIT